MKGKVFLSGVICLSLFLGTIYGYHMALSNGSGFPTMMILKTAYAIERYQSISDIPDDFRARWEDRIRAFSDHHSVGVYVGEGTNATPILPLQLDKMGFHVVRFGHDEMDRIRGCSLVIFPGGHYSLEWDDQSIRTVQDYISNGGGFIGICLGCVAAQRFGLIRADLRPCPITGLVDCKTDPVFFHGKKWSVFLHMNGRIFRNSDLSPLITWDDNVMGGVKNYGKGRIVLFSSHPEGGKIEHGSRYILAEGTDLGTMDLLLDAVFYVASAN